jgi:hypothetical protein
MKEGFPVLSSYTYGAENWSISQVDVIVSIKNNNSISLFNAVVELSYKNVDDVWVTATKTDLGFIDVQEGKRTEVTITNPHLLLWDTKRPKYTNEGTIWENVTVYVLNIPELRVTAYGFAKP